MINRDLSYNDISFLGDESNQLFKNQKLLFDLFLSNNIIREINEYTLVGLSSLQILDLEGNKIRFIHVDAFTHVTQLRDLWVLSYIIPSLNVYVGVCLHLCVKNRNLGRNYFSILPTKGLENLRQIKTFSNPRLKDFPAPDVFPKIQTLALSYAYHCCQFLPLSHPSTLKPPTLEETIVWLPPDSDSSTSVEDSRWSKNITDLWSKLDNNITTMSRVDSEVWKIRSDYNQDAISHLTEEYLEDYKSLFAGEDNTFLHHPIQCLPQPGEIIMSHSPLFCLLSQTVFTTDKTWR